MIDIDTLKKAVQGLLDSLSELAKKVAQVFHSLLRTKLPSDNENMIEHLSQKQRITETIKRGLERSKLLECDHDLLVLTEQQYKTLAGIPAPVTIERARANDGGIIHERVQSVAPSVDITCSPSAKEMMLLDSNKLGLDKI